MHNKLLRILESERAAIICADFEKVEALAAPKQALFDQALKLASTKAEMSEIHAALQRNQTLFQAAIDGVTAARTRIDALREVRDNLRTYDESGRVAQIMAKAPDLIKRS